MIILLKTIKISFFFKGRKQGKRDSSLTIDQKTAELNAKISKLTLLIENSSNIQEKRELDKMKKFLEEEKREFTKQTQKFIYLPKQDESILQKEIASLRGT